MPKARPSSCLSDNLVHQAASNCYRELNRGTLTLQRLNLLIQSSDGYLAQYYATIRPGTCASKERAQVFANAMIAAVDAASEIGRYPPPGANLGLYPTIVGLGLPLQDPAQAAFIIINILLSQYSTLVTLKGDDAATANVFSQAFQAISNSLLTALNASGNTYLAVVDLTYISAVAHYLDLQLRIDPPIPILNYIPTF